MVFDCPPVNAKVPPHKHVDHGWLSLPSRVSLEALLGFPPGHGSPGESSCRHIAMWALPCGHAPCGHCHAGIAMRASPCRHCHAGIALQAQATEHEGGRLQGGPEQGCCWMPLLTILPAFASGWDPRSELSDVKEQIMFTASGTSCQNRFHLSRESITLPSAKHGSLCVRTLPGRTKRYTLACEWVWAPLRPWVLSVWPPAEAPACQEARSQSDVEVGQACAQPPRPLGTLEAQTQCVLTHATGQPVSSGTRGQVTPCLP